MNPVKWALELAIRRENRKEITQRYGETQKHLNPCNPSSIFMVVSESRTVIHIIPKSDNEAEFLFSFCSVTVCRPFLERDMVSGKGCQARVALPLEGRLVTKVATVPSAPEWECFVLETKPLRLHCYIYSSLLYPCLWARDFNSQNPNTVCVREKQN